MAEKWEPAPEEVETMAKDLCSAFNGGDRGAQPWNRLTNEGHNGYRAEARFVLTRQHEREAFVVERIKRAQQQIRDGYHPSWAEQTLEQALIHLAKLDAPQPTLAECEKRLRDLWDNAQSNKVGGLLSDALDAWKAAAEREERK